MASQHLWAFFNPQEAHPTYTEVPEDVDAAAKDRMLLLARYAMQNGASFVDMVRTKQAGNPEYDFLNVPGSTSYAFFRWALFATGCGLPVDQPLPEGFTPPAPTPQPQPQPQQQYAPPVQPVPSPQQQMMYPHPHPGYGQPYMQQPMQQQHYQQQQPPRPTPPPIPPEVAGGFSQVLDALTGSKDSIKASQGWFMACAPYAAGMAYMMASRASTTAEFDKLLHLVYLANDILFKAFTAAQQQQQQTADGQQQQQQGAADAQAQAQASWTSIRAAFAPALGIMLAAAQAAAASSSNEAGREKLTKMLTFWQDKGLFDAALMARIQQEMATADPANALLRSYPPAVPPPDQQQQQQQGPASGGWGVPPAAAAAAAGYPPPAGWPPAAAAAAAGPWGMPHQQAVPPGAVPPGWPAVPPGAVPPGMPSPWGYPGQPGAPVPPVPPVYPGAVPPGMPYHGVPPGGYPGAAVPPGAVPPPHAPPGMPPPGAPSPSTNPAIAMAAAAAAAAAAAMRGEQHPNSQQQQQPEPVNEPVSSFNFPPGLIPQLVRDKSKWSEPYAAIDPIEVEKAGLPPPPEKDAYLKSRLDKFMLELRDYKPGTCRADLEEARAAARAQQGLEPDSDEELALGSSGSRLARRKALGLGAGGAEGRRRHRVVAGGMADDGSYVGPGGGRGERLGLGAHGSSASAGLGDVYSSYRQMRSSSYHEMIVRGSGVSNMAKGGS